MNEDMLNVMGSFISTELDAFENLHKELEEKDKEIERLTKTLEKIKTIINNEKITGIEAKLMIKDILEEK